jgi:hypothetical protein
MKHQRFNEQNDNEAMKFETDEFVRCLPIFQRLGLKPRRYFSDQEAAYVGTVEGWFRLSFTKYSKQELKWLRRILDYLNERSFHNWAVPWQKTIIWEEHTFCYLIQPWIIAKEHFESLDPASVSRIAEITTELYSCGKDYFENRGIEIVRDRWQSIDLEWENELHKLDQLRNDFEHEKIRKEVDELRRIAVAALSESLDGWKKSGLSLLLEHHQRSGVLGHGNLLKKNIVWLNNDYYLLNWEGLAFQPRIVDIASLINDVAWWEPEWILFLLNEYAKIQPFWPEEQVALFALLKYPQKIIDLLRTGVSEESLNRKDLKEEAKELARKERCLLKAWKELGTHKRWVWGRQSDMPPVSQGKISMVLSPVESWGDFAGQADSLIHVKHEQKLPKDVMERLTYNESDRIVAGRDGNVLESAAKVEAAYNENNFVEIVEPQPKIPDEAEPEQPPEEVKATEIEPLQDLNNVSPELAAKDEEQPVNNIMKTVIPQVTKWPKFPKPLGANKKFGHR